MRLVSKNTNGAAADDVIIAIIALHSFYQTLQSTTPLDKKFYHFYRNGPAENNPL